MNLFVGFARHVYVTGQLAQQAVREIAHHALEEVIVCAGLLHVKDLLAIDCEAAVVLLVVDEFLHSTIASPVEVFVV